MIYRASPKGEIDPMKKLIFAVCAILALVGATLLVAAAKPKTVIHIITIQWTANATPAQIDKAIKAAENMKYAGLKNVWTRPIKMQLPDGYKNIIVMGLVQTFLRRAYFMFSAALMAL